MKPCRAFARGLPCSFNRRKSRRPQIGFAILRRQTDNVHRPGRQPRGGGYDRPSAFWVARPTSASISPGTPTIIVQNMPGARASLGGGPITSTMAAARDGSVIALVMRSMFADKATGTRNRYASNIVGLNLDWKHQQRSGPGRRAWHTAPSQSPANDLFEPGVESSAATTRRRSGDDAAGSLNAASSARSSRSSNGYPRPPPKSFWRWKGENCRASGDWFMGRA